MQIITPQCGFINNKDLTSKSTSHETGFLSRDTTVYQIVDLESHDLCYFTTVCNLPPVPHNETAFGIKFEKSYLTPKGIIIW